MHRPVKSRDIDTAAGSLHQRLFIALSLSIHYFKGQIDYLKPTATPCLQIIMSSSANALRGAASLSPLFLPPTIDHRTLHTDTDSLLLSLTPSLQITLSLVLASILLLQLTLVAFFLYHRHSRFLEFAQPTVINIGNVASLLITATCYLFVFPSEVGCILREPILFTLLTMMGATVAGRAWRISILFSPMIHFGRGSSPSSSLTSQESFLERTRQFLLQFLRGATGRESPLLGGTNRIQVQISIWRSLRAMGWMVLPQFVLQTLLVGIPATRLHWKSTTVYQGDDHGMTISMMQCQSTTGREWQIALSLLFAILPYTIAWILNQRPKSELDKLPAAEMIDERIDLQRCFWVVFRVLVTTSPLIGMSLSPNVRVYATICVVLSLPLSICYFISYSKLASMDVSSNWMMKKTHYFGNGSDGDGKSSVAYAVRMAEMYVKIGRHQETLSCCEETLSLWRKGGSRQNHTMGFGVREDTEEIGSGFTKSDLADLSPEELELIIQLLKIKGRTFIAVYGHQEGSAMYAQLHVDILKIFEQCPASAKLKDPSIIFPVYNYLGIQIRGGAFDQDDVCSLEVDLAERFQYEAQVQAFHLARALANLADVYGRTGHCEEAFRYFDIMQSIYMKEQ